MARGGMVMISKQLTICQKEINTCKTETEQFGHYRSISVKLLLHIAIMLEKIEYRLGH